MARRGRPRKNPVEVSPGQDPAEDILLAASELFAIGGFAGTTTAAIARRAGLQQPSIFYYFRTKEEIFRTLADKAIVKPLRALAAIEASSGSYAVKLFRLISFQVTHDLSEPYEMSVIVDEALRRERAGLEHWREATEDYTRGMRRLVHGGTADGEFVPNDPFTTTMAILGMCNWSLKWYRKGGSLTPQTIAADFARLSLRGLLTDPATIDDVAAEAAALDRDGAPLGLHRDGEQSPADRMPNT